jgi:hypothetical protein
VRALRDAGTMNPVILLDEVDKVGADWRGDPSAALLEVLDPAQNSTFRDHYLDVELDLSEVVFIATANQAETIPGPLLDRMEVIRFDGYTVEEKVAIARDYLFPRQRERNGPARGRGLRLDDLLRTIVSEYTREAGVRSLERELGTLLRKTATRIASGKAEAPVRLDLDARPRRPRAPEGLPGGRGAHGGAGRGDGPGGDGHGRRRPVRRGQRHEGHVRRAHAHGPARRRHEGVHPDRPHLRAGARRRARHLRGRLRRPRVPRPRPRGRDPEGRPERGRHDDHGARVAAVGARR